MLARLAALLGLSKKPSLYIRPLKEHDIGAVLAIEEKMYHYPWSESIFKDCLKVGYSNWAYVKNEQLIGYVILSVAAAEAHILNICLDPAYTGKGIGRQFLQETLAIAKKKKAESVFLEVRPSNTVAVKLYKKTGFKQIGQRKNYYPAKEGREDALVLSYQLE